MPRWMLMAAVVIVALSAIPFALIAGYRQAVSGRTRIAIIQDMGKQPKYRAQAVNPAFADNRAMRLPVAGTIARGELADDPRFYRGSEGDKWLETIPVPVTLQFLQRGQQRFNIYCSACHGLGGYGDGPISQRAAEMAAQLQQAAVVIASYHSDVVRPRKAGEIFNTITNGVRNMPPYGSQIDVHDRWAIVSYVRALQRSQAASLEDVPPDRREDLR